MGADAMFLLAIYFTRSVGAEKNTVVITVGHQAIRSGEITMVEIFETLHWMLVRFVQLIPVMVIFGFLGHLLDKDNARFAKKQEKLEKKKRKENLKKYF